LLVVSGCFFCARSYTPNTEVVSPPHPHPTRNRSARYDTAIRNRIHMEGKAEEQWCYDQVW
jgi:hypothetical protein